MDKLYELKIKYWAEQMDIAQEKKDYDRYNLCVLKVQEFEYKLESLYN
jgi:hypothetical protein